LLSGHGGRAGFHRKEVLVIPSQNQFPNLSQPDSSSPNQPDLQAGSSPSPEPAKSAETSTNNMDQQPNATLESAPPIVLDSSEAMSEENLEIESAEKPKAIPPLVPPRPAPAPSPVAVTAPSEPEPEPEPQELDVNRSEPDEVDEAEAQVASMRQQPIPPASEPMQYRAIGLVRGRYEPSDEQFTRGFLHTEDGTAIDAVLLGRVMSLVKKHVDLEQPHLWVVYPRTREKTVNLHVQIVGVWEPENLNKVEDSEPPAAAEPEALPDSETAQNNAVESAAVERDRVESETVGNETADQASEQNAADSSVPEHETEAIASPGHEDGYFSIRGEVLFQAQEDQRLIVKIQQSPRRGDSQGKAFKLNLQGSLDGKAVGYFWDLQVQRQENLLVVKDGSMIGLVPPKKRKDSKGGRKGGRPTGGGYGKKRWEGAREGQRPTRSDRPTGAPPQRREPIAKPIKRRDNSSPSNPG
jgi:hypothetical protein